MFLDLYEENIIVKVTYRRYGYYVLQYMLWKGCLFDRHTSEIKLVGKSTKV